MSEILINTDDFITKTSYGYSLDTIIPVKLNNNKQVYTLLDPKSREKQVGLKNPLTLKEFINKINLMSIPGKKRNPFTYAFIELEDILFCPLFNENIRTNSIVKEENIERKSVPKDSEYGLMILSLLREKLKDYLFIINGKEYLVYFQMIESVIELLNKHGSLVAHLKNVILQTPEIMNNPNIVNINLFHNATIEEIDYEIYMLYFYHGSAGEVILKKTKENNYTLFYNFLSGTLMERYYNKEQRLNLSSVIFTQLKDEFNPSYKYKTEFTSKSLIDNLDKTSDVIKLIKLGYDFYKINNEKLLEQIERFNPITVGGLFTKFKTEINKIITNLIFIGGLSKEQKMDIRKQLMEYSNNINPDMSYQMFENINNYLNELKNNPAFSNDLNIFNNLDKLVIELNEYFQTQMIIKNDIMVSQNRVNEYELKRPLIGGKKGRKNKKTRKHKNKKHNKTRKHKTKKHKTRKHNKTRKHKKTRKQKHKTLKKYK